MIRRGCALIVLVFAVLFAGYFAFFTRYFEWPGNLIAAAVGQPEILAHDSVLVRERVVELGDQLQRDALGRLEGRAGSVASWSRTQPWAWLST